MKLFHANQTVMARNSNIKLRRDDPISKYLRLFLVASSDFKLPQTARTRMSASAAFTSLSVKCFRSSEIVRPCLFRHALAIDRFKGARCMLSHAGHTFRKALGMSGVKLLCRSRQLRIISFFVTPATKQKCNEHSFQQ